MPSEAPAFYEYSKKNPEAQKAVDAVIQAFSKPPLTIEQFVENCDMQPLPTDDASFKNFCLQYPQEIQAEKDSQQVVAIQKENNQDENQVVQKEEVAKQNTQAAETKEAENAAKRKEIHDLLAT